MFEQITKGTTTRKLHYIPGGDGLAAIYVENGQNDTMYYIHKDHLGSFDVVTGESGNVVERMSFDPWGRRRNPTNWTYSGVSSSYTFERGYTGHEHIDEFGLVNMNGRVYDAVLGRFLSPDKIVQAPSFTQSYNRYSYVFNNPLRFIDPSGWEGEEDDDENPYKHSVRERLGGGATFRGPTVGWYSYWGPNATNSTFGPIYGRMSEEAKKGPSFEDLNFINEDGEIISKREIRESINENCLKLVPVFTGGEGDNPGFQHMFSI